MCRGKIKKSIRVKWLEVLRKKVIKYYHYLSIIIWDMNETQLNFIIKKLSKKIGKLISDDEIKSLQIEYFAWDVDIKKFYKLIFILKQRQYLIPLKKDLYIVSYPENLNLNISNVIDKFYWELLHKQITSKCKKNYYIGSTKALELYLNNYSIPNQVEIYNEKYSESHAIISDYNWIFKQYPDTKKSYHSKVKNLFQACKSNRQSISIEKNEYFLGPIEICILESLYYIDKTATTYQNDLIKKCIKKYKAKRDRNLIKEIISSGKHHTSLNRLYEICKYEEKDFANSCLEIIKIVWFRISL